MITKTIHLNGGIFSAKIQNTKAQKSPYLLHQALKHDVFHNNAIKHNSISFAGLPSKNLLKESASTVKKVVEGHRDNVISSTIHNLEKDIKEITGKFLKTVKNERNEKFIALEKPLITAAEGDYEAARAASNATLAYLKSLASGHPELKSLISSLQIDASGHLTGPISAINEWLKAHSASTISFASEHLNKAVGALANSISENHGDFAELTGETVNHIAENSGDFAELASEAANHVVENSDDFAEVATETTKHVLRGIWDFFTS